VLPVRTGTWTDVASPLRSPVSVLTETDADRHRPERRPRPRQRAL